MEEERRGEEIEGRERSEDKRFIKLKQWWNDGTGCEYEFITVSFNSSQATRGDTICWLEKVNDVLLKRRFYKHRQRRTSLS